MSTLTTPPRRGATPAPSALTGPIVEPGDQRIAIRDVRWEIYDLLSDAVGERQRVFLAYDGKDLEIMTKGRAHEDYREILLRFVIFLTSELRIRCRGAGETAWKRPEIARGLESDLCYFFTPEKRAADAEALSRGLKGIEHYPNPDMAIEIDLSVPEIDRPGIYAALKVTELWRFDGVDFIIENLQPDGTYQPVEMSLFLPVRGEEIRRWVIDEDFAKDELAWEQRLRAWARAELMPRQNAG
jgi:Uma2 family endonuclease